MNWYGDDSLMSTLANWLEVAGFIITLATLVVAGVIGSEIRKLKTTHLLDKTLPLHVKRLNAIAAELNNLVLNVQANERLIRPQLQELRAELAVLVNKLGWTEGWAIRMLLWDVRARCKGRLVKDTSSKRGHFQRFIRRLSFRRDSSTEDVWDIHDKVHHARAAIQLIISDRRNTLRT